MGLKRVPLPLRLLKPGSGSCNSSNCSSKCVDDLKPRSPMANESSQRVDQKPPQGAVTVEASQQPSALPVLCTGCTGCAGWVTCHRSTSYFLADGGVGVR